MDLLEEFPESTHTPPLNNGGESEIVSRGTGITCTGFNLIGGNVVVAFVLLLLLLHPQSSIAINVNVDKVNRELNLVLNLGIG
jgi:hypothetical protein